MDHLNLDAGLPGEQPDDSITPVVTLDDVLSPSEDGPGHLASLYNFDTDGDDDDDAFHVETDTNALACLNHALYSNDPAFPAQEVTDFVFKRRQAGVYVTATSPAEAWASIYSGWSALEYLADLPGWAAAACAEGDINTPGAKLRALADLTARLLGDSEAVTVKTINCVLRHLHGVSGAFNGVALLGLVRALAGALATVSDDPDLRLDLMDVDWDDFFNMIDDLLDDAEGVGAGEEALAALTLLRAAAERADQVAGFLLDKEEGCAPDSPTAAAAFPASGSSGGDSPAACDDDASDAASDLSNGDAASGWSFYGDYYDYPLTAEELRADLDWDVDQFEIKGTRDIKHSFAELLSYFVTVAEYTAGLDPASAGGRLAADAAADGADILAHMEAAGYLDYNPEDKEDFAVELSEEARALFLSAGASAVPQAASVRLATQQAALTDARYKTYLAKRNLKQQADDFAEKLAERDAAVEAAEREAFTQRREAQAAVAAARRQAAAAEKERAALQAALEEERAAAAARVAAALQQQNEKAAAAVLAAREELIQGAAQAQVAISALEGEKKAAAAAAAAAVAAAAGALAEAQQTAASAAADAAAARKEASIARAVLQALRAGRDAAAAESAGQAEDEGSPAALHAFTQTYQHKKEDALASAEEGSCGSPPAASPAADSPTTPTADDEAGAATTLFASAITSPQESETASLASTEGEGEGAPASPAAESSLTDTEDLGASKLELTDSSSSGHSCTGGEERAAGPPPSRCLSPVAAVLLLISPTVVAQLGLAVATMAALQQRQRKLLPSDAVAVASGSGRVAPRPLRAAAALGGSLRRLKAKMDDMAAAKKKKKAEKAARERAAARDSTPAAPAAPGRAGFCRRLTKGTWGVVYTASVAMCMGPGWPAATS